MDVAPVFVLFFQSIIPSFGDLPVSSYQDETILEECGGSGDIYPPLPFPDAFLAASIGPKRQAVFVPYKILFLIDDTMSQANKVKLEKSTRYAQEKLTKVIQAPRLDDVRFRQFPATANSCSEVCNSQGIPAEYLTRCSVAPDQNIPEQPTAEIVKQNAENYTLVVLLVVHGDGHGFGGESDICAKPWGVAGYAGRCITDDDLRPTHGRIVFCKNQSDSPDDNVADITLHEMLHILSPDVVCSNDPVQNCPPQQMDPMAPDAADHIPGCKDRLWKQVDRQWLNQTGEIETRPAFIAIVDPLPKAAKAHFGCDSVDGFELHYGKRNQSYSPDFGHWSHNMFPDEILSPVRLLSRRLSVLTLSALAACRSWYKVDLAYAERLTVSKPSPELGCAVNEKSCWEILRDEGRKKAPRFLAPYCDTQTGAGHASSFCSKDHKMRTVCNPKVQGCPVLLPDVRVQGEYDHPECEKTNSFEPHLWLSTAGAGVGKGTICVTFTYIPYLSPQDQSLPLCVAHECRLDPPAIVLKFQPPNAGPGVCFVECPRDKSKQIMDFTKPKECVNQSEDHYSIICPDYEEVCGSAEPGVSDPGVSNPGVSDPGVSNPGVADPGVSGAPSAMPVFGLILVVLRALVDSVILP